MSARSVAERILAEADVKVNGDRPWDIQVHDERLFKRALTQGSLGVGEAYMDGWWDCPALDQLFEKVLAAQLDQKLGKNFKLIAHLLLSKLMNLQSKGRSLKVAKVHYNLDNDLYERMLGPSMAYTCAYFKDTDNLDEAQNAKYDLVCRKLDLKSTDRVLELGCGWGGFAKYAATHYGCQMESVNISEEQIKFARQSCQGLSVNFHQCDYRDSNAYNPQQQPFDKVVSIGMCEHVGHKNYRKLMRLVYKQLKSGGTFLLHTIGGNRSLTKADAWIDKYIFPGGMLPSVKQLATAFEGLFIMEDWHNFGVDYSKTLMAWYKNYKAHWSELKDRYDERFDRMWSYYLLCCAGMFRARDAQLWQVVLSKDGVNGGYRSLR